MMVAAYPMAEEKWTADEAMKENESAFGFSRFHGMICLRLSSYERRFPQEFASDPAFQSLRTSRKPESRFLQCAAPDSVSRQ